MWRAPRWAQKLSYDFFPSRRRITKRLARLNTQALSLFQTQARMIDLIQSDKPFLVGRPGGTESEGMAFFLRYRLSGRTGEPKPYPHSYRNLVRIGPGVTHRDDTDLDYFHLKYLEASLDTDLFGFGLFAPGALDMAIARSNSGTDICPIEHLEPLLALDGGTTPWTRALEGRRVLVVHPFEDTIKRQYRKRKKISGVSEMLPHFHLQTLRPPVTFAGEPSDMLWREHFEEVAKTVATKEFDIAIIGAGSYGLPLAHEIKKSGRQAIHLGGSLQLLFGIAGKRWEGISPFDVFIDETWVKPTPAETPKGHNTVEGGAYW